MKLPQFNHIDPSLRSARVQPVTRSYVPQRRAMQLSTRLPIDVREQYQANMTKAKVLSSTIGSAIKAAESIYDMKAKSESDLAAAKYEQAMSNWVAERELSPLKIGEMPGSWHTSREDYLQASREKLEEITENGVGSELGMRRLKSQIIDFDTRAQASLRKLHRKNTLTLMQHDGIEFMKTSNDKDAIENKADEMVGLQVMSPDDANALVEEAHKRIDMTAISRVYAAMSTSVNEMSEHQLNTTIDEYTNLVMSADSLVDQQMTLIGKVKGLRDQWDDQRDIRADAAFDKFVMAITSRDIREVNAAVQMTSSTGARDMLGKHFVNARKMADKVFTEGRTSRQARDTVARIIDDVEVGRMSADIAKQNISAMEDLTGTDYAAALRAIRSAADSNYQADKGAAEDQIDLMFLNDIDPTRVTRALNAESNEAFAAHSNAVDLYKRQLRLYREDIEQGRMTADEVAFAVMVHVNRPQEWMVNSAGNYTNNPLEVDLLKSSDQARQKEYAESQGETWATYAGMFISQLERIRQLQNIAANRAMGGLLGRPRDESPIGEQYRGVSSNNQSEVRP